MSSSWVVFVEGTSDEAFVRCLLRVLDMDEGMVEIGRMGGGINTLEAIAPTMQQRSNAGSRIAIILDANSDPEGQRKKFQNKKKDLDLPIERAFFTPNDDEPGCLETLLEQIAAPAHKKIYGCLDAYAKCLRDLNASYKAHLDSKARIFAYCEAIGAETREDKKYDCADHWDLNAPVLEPLKRFLRRLT